MTTPRLNKIDIATLAGFAVGLVVGMVATFAAFI